MKNYITAFIFCLSLAVSFHAAAEPIKRNMLGCVSEELLDEVLGYAAKRDTNSMSELVMSGKCAMLRAGETVSVISPGFTVATIRYKGVKLFTPSEAIR